MVRIVSDTSTMYSTSQAREAGFSVSPLAVTIAGQSFRELDKMPAEEFVSIRVTCLSVASLPLAR